MFLSNKRWRWRINKEFVAFGLILLGLVFVRENEPTVSKTTYEHIQQVSRQKAVAASSSSTGSTVATVAAAADPPKKAVPQKPLNFLHVPKTGGSAIMKASVNANLTWGDCFFRPGSMAGTFTCTEASKAERRFQGVRMPGGQRKTTMRLCGHHLPMQHLPVVDDRNKTNTNPYLDYDIFVIIRNPYDRLLSEYYFRSLALGGKNMNCTQLHDARHMNAYLLHRVPKMYQCTSPNCSYYTQDCNHYIPQAHYVYNYNHKNNQQGERLVKHLLRYESIATEFLALMQQYGLQNTVTLPQKRINDSTQTAKCQPKSLQKRLGAVDLANDTIAWINAVYADDFALGGYIPLPVAAEAVVAVQKAAAAVADKTRGTN